MISKYQVLPQQRGSTRATIEDLLLDAAVSTAFEAIEAGEFDEAQVILSMTDQVLGGRVLAEDHNVSTLAAHTRSASREHGFSGSIIQLG
ncbi:hypothetical protein E1202_30535 [Saccharopolyspora karakumensis]|uniref:Uncharacterized protein n=1 Tax=Saccharopolyspora karakumensis TaxID=2530386 RepID=A0A4R5B4W2_9PSEU|nr:hypothetical protein [Saccharopolyspora karakumensis]TDD80285.1 hypothetical protein E1202_30535 [Saccharopolyspora karakumensis]